MSEKDIIDLIDNGSLDAFLDCLDYAPIGVIDLIKKFSVSVPMKDYDKREALKNKTGFDVSKAIDMLEAEKFETNNKTAENGEVAPATEAKSTGRRTNTNYKVVKKEQE
jgi:hypothetical protein